jgi:putative ABC transport system permease protein
MSFLTLITKNLTRKLARTLLLILSVAIAFSVFGVLTSVNEGFSLRGEARQRLVTVSKIGVNDPLPVTHAQAIMATAGVARTAYAARLRGYYLEPHTVIGVNAVPLPDYATVYADDFLFPTALQDKIAAQRNGALIGRMLAQRMNWQVGQRVTITSNSIRQRNGSLDWTFDILGIFDGQRSTVDTGFMIIRYDYLNEARLSGQDTVDGFVFLLEPGTSVDLVRQAIDQTFLNSAAQTRTGTESELNRAFAAQFANISLIVTVVLAVAFLTILLIVANTMAFAVRERRTEIGILKAIGFPASTIIALIAAEMVFICVGGGLIGLGGATLFIAFFGEELQTLAPSVSLSWATVAQAIVLMLAVTAITTAAPLGHALRLKVIQAIRRV